jgi:hypothetical protein
MSARKGKMHYIGEMKLVFSLLCCCCLVVGQAQTISQNSKPDSTTKEYRFTVRLTNAFDLYPACGIIAFALAQKFQVISTDFPNYKHQFVVLIEPCPEFLGKKFFETDTVYVARVASNSGVSFSYTVYNPYQSEEWPILWIRNIAKVKPHK